MSDKNQIDTESSTSYEGSKNEMKVSITNNFFRDFEKKGYIF